MMFVCIGFLSGDQAGIKLKYAEQKHVSCAFSLTKQCPENYYNEIIDFIVNFWRIYGKNV
jgi:hypothetical protein